MQTFRLTWLQRLNSDPESQEAAIVELRQILKRRLAYSLRFHSQVDDSFLEDAVQDSLVSILNSLSQFEERSLFTTWATTIAIRTAYTELRRRRWKDVSLEQLVGDRELAFDVSDQNEYGPDRAMARDDLVVAMHEVIRTELTDRQRTALLAELEGCPLAEIGRRMGSTRNAMYKLTHDARKRLKKGLEAAGYSAADLQNLRENRK